MKNIVEDQEYLISAADTEEKIQAGGMRFRPTNNVLSLFETGGQEDAGVQRTTESGVGKQERADHQDGSMTATEFAVVTMM